MRIDDATSIDDHINKAVAQDCFLSKETPLPEDVAESVALTPTTRPARLRPFWAPQLKRAAEYADLSQGAHRIRDNAAPREIKSAAGRMKSIAISALLNNYDIGGAVWMSRFSYGFRLAGDISQEGVFPRDTSLNPAPPSMGSG